MKNLLLLFVVFQLTSCQSQQSKTIETVDGKTYSDKLSNTKNPQLLDVRTPEEYAVEHLENASNVNWNGNDFVSKVEKLDKSQPVFVYCKVGGRSSQAANKLAELGFNEIYNLDGGIMKWQGKKTSNVSSPKGLTSAEFEKLINSDKKVIINFSAKWCAPCKKMAPYLTKMQEELKGKITLVKLDADENKTLMESMKLNELPVILIYENGKETWRNLGYLSEEDFRLKI
ncbi:thioredoxin domain-containing protein [Flavobacterium dankookense]|uniref:Thioredoxin n=1 Tax=Flavobacterium dankookense TaxID=706186 RepID=A0A4R6QEI4_9FLAO|nr:thioredoxin domain-containing protein [Flavobacterium dankookense]TDP60750.1 thioredoxin [Flavobacterium dankookense]